MSNQELVPVEPVALAPISPEALIMRAIERDVSVESLERLLAMRQTLKAEQAREAYITAMAEFQRECPVIGKNKTAEVRDKETGRTKYTYKFAPLDAIVEQTSALRAKYGFSYSFDTAFDDSPPAMIVTCLIQHREGHRETSTFRTPIDTNARQMTVMQQSASALTYAKRYAFCNAFGILTGDEDTDDGNTGQPAAPRPAFTTRPVPAATGETRQPTEDEMRMVSSASDFQEGPKVAETPKPTSRGNVVRVSRQTQAPTPIGEIIPGVVEPVSAEVSRQASRVMEQRAALRAEVFGLGHRFITKRTQAAGRPIEVTEKKVTEWLESFAQRAFGGPYENLTSVQLQEMQEKMTEWLKEMGA